jgi:hypothetical protein
MSHLSPRQRERERAQQILAHAKRRRSGAQRPGRGPFRLASAWRRPRTWLATALAGAALSGVALVSIALAETIAVTPTGVTLAKATGETALTNTKISGYESSAVLLVSISTTVGTLSMSTHSGLTLSNGYSSWEGSHYSFTGEQSSVNTALATLALHDTGTIGTAKVEVSVTKNESGLEYLPETGHFYEYVKYSPNNLTWGQAKSDAEGLTFDGEKGYLASIPTKPVNEFIQEHLNGAENVWAGGESTDYPSGYLGNTGIKRVWRWIAGPHKNEIFTECENISTSCIRVDGHWSQWNPGEPNNSGYSSGTPGSGEHYLEINTGGSGNWNDLAASSDSNNEGYVAEFGGEGSGFTNFYSGTANITLANAPGAPTVTSASGGSEGGGEATVKWTAPASEGSAITGYTITPYVYEGGSWVAKTSLAVSAGASATSAMVPGLTNGTTYRFKVTATNAAGTSSPGESASATVSGKPSTPGAPTASAGAGQATVSWTAPASNGSTITKYVVTSSPGSKTCEWSSGATECTVTGLTNGTPYTFTVTATNANGTTAASGASSAVTPLEVPGAPTAVTVSEAGTPQGGQAKVSWTAPTNTGGTTITGYSIIPYKEGVAQTPVPITGAVESATVTGLENGKSYTFKVAAINSQGTGSASSASSGATVSGKPSTPGAPTASAGAGQATVSWTASASNGSTITKYVVTSSPGSKTCEWTTGATECTVTGLTNGTPYTFTVTATNANGTTAASGASSAVTPLEVPAAPTEVSATGMSPGGGTAFVSWQAPAIEGGAAITIYTITPYKEGVAQSPVTVGAPAASATITGLENGASYTFTVAAVNAKGTGLASQHSNATTIAVTPGPPTNVLPTPGYGSVTVTFQPPPNPPGGTITGYAVSIDGGVTWQTVTATVRSDGTIEATLTGLREGATYSLAVRAESTAGYGEPSALVQVTLPTAKAATVTAAPAVPVPTVLTSRRIITIHWLVPSTVTPGPFSVTMNGHIYKKLSARARRVTVSMVGMKGPASVLVRISTLASSGTTLATTRLFHICAFTPLRPRRTPILPITDLRPPLAGA